MWYELHITYKLYLVIKVFDEYNNWNNNLTQNAVKVRDR